MPEDTAKIGVVREPMAQLMSTFKFYHVLDPGELGMEADMNTIERFLENPEYYSKKRKRINALTKNRVATEFGYRDYFNLTEYLKKIESEFTVLVLEMFDESLILLKRKLCWSFKDVLYLPMRQKSYDHNINETLVGYHKAWSPYDYAFYDYFRHVLISDIDSQDNDFQVEVKRYMQISDDTKEFCSDICQHLREGVEEDRDHDYMKQWLDKIISFEKSTWNDAFDISGVECLMMMFDPNIYRYSQRVKQWPDICHGEILPGTRMKIVRKFCQEHFAYTFPWSILYDSHGTFLFDCI